MRHLVAGKSLNVDTQHRLALRRNLARSLFLHDRIVTTPTKAKAVRGFVERLITRARKAVVARDAKDKGAWLHQVRTIARDVPDKVALRRLITEIAPRCNRPGGYTRVVRDWKNQVGDNAPRAIFELVDKPEAAPEPPAETPAEAKAAKKAKKAAKPAAADRT